MPGTGTGASQAPPPAGPAADARGLTALDPSENVKALNEAGLKRQDDLREMEAKHLRELMTMGDRFAGELREAEAKRIDAIRAVDVSAVNRAAEVAAVQAATLAGQVAASAEALRSQVATTATAFRAELAAALEPIQKRIDDLTRAQYEAQGQKTQVVEGRQSNAAIYGAIAAVGAVLGIIIIVVGLIISSTGTA